MAFELKMKNHNEFPDKDRKNCRREKFKNKRNKPSRYDFDDLPPKNIEKNIKKKKEHFQEEEWEDWDRYYNH